MKILNLIWAVAAIVMISSCGNNKNYRNPDELQSYDKAETEQPAAAPAPESNSVKSENEESEDNHVLTEMVSNGLPSIIDFTATWCGPCRMMKPIFHKLAEDFAGEYNFVSIDIDEHPELAEKYQIQAVPTFIFLDADGNEGNRKTGAISEKEFRDELLNPAWF